MSYLQKVWTTQGRNPGVRIYDGPDEVHRVTVARQVLRDYTPNDGPWPPTYVNAESHWWTSIYTAPYK